MRKTLIGAALAAAFSFVHAETYTFSVDGTQRHWIDAWECPATICAPDMLPYVDSTWHSTFVAVAPDGDGTFADGVSYTLGGVRIFPYPTNLLGPILTLTLTVAGGVLSFDGTAVDGPGHYNFDGMSVFYDDGGSQHYGPTWHTGVISHAPEPETYALMLAGLGLLAWRRKGQTPR